MLTYIEQCGPSAAFTIVIDVYVLLGVIITLRVTWRHSARLIRYNNKLTLKHIWFAEFIELYSRRITYQLIWPSSTTSEVSKHIFLEHPERILWNWRTLKSWQLNPDGLKEGWRKPSIWALNPSLNRDGGRYNLPPAWDNIIKKRVKTRGGGGIAGFRHHAYAYRPHDNGTTKDWWSWQESVKAFI